MRPKVRAKRRDRIYKIYRTGMEGERLGTDREAGPQITQITQKDEM